MNGQHPRHPHQWYHAHHEMSDVWIALLATVFFVGGVILQFSGIAPIPGFVLYVAAVLVGFYSAIRMGQHERD